MNALNAGVLTGKFQDCQQNETANQKLPSEHCSSPTRLHHDASSLLWVRRLRRPRRDSSSDAFGFLPMQIANAARRRSRMTSRRSGDASKLTWSADTLAMEPDKPGGVADRLSMTSGVDFADDACR
ncbi:hypothetical protein HPB47_010817 [Ixodes persulcatus]|uniref:Uncharacterized protein n=1 Tax=Ixodes persulcatus TaxID=34615 RepID=A0AC60NYT8_IXOPE|nr:hypothetical protein HPB47_010817 [Ixodes persulcatus]